MSRKTTFKLLLATHPLEMAGEAFKFVRGDSSGVIDRLDLHDAQVQETLADVAELATRVAASQSVPEADC